MQSIGCSQVSTQRPQYYIYIDLGSICRSVHGTRLNCQFCKKGWRGKGVPLNIFLVSTLQWNDKSRDIYFMWTFCFAYRLWHVWYSAGGLPSLLSTSCRLATLRIELCLYLYDWGMLLKKKIEKFILFYIPNWTNHDAELLSILRVTVLHSSYLSLSCCFWVTPKGNVPFCSYMGAVIYHRVSLLYHPSNRHVFKIPMVLFPFDWLKA